MSKYHCFISYTWRLHKDRVHLFAGRLMQSFHVWIDKKKMQHGDIYEMMQKGISESHVFVCCVTFEYAKSENCMREIKYALALNKKIIYVIFDDIYGAFDANIVKKYDKIGFMFSGDLYYKYNQFSEIQKLIHRLTKTVSSLQTLTKKPVAKNLDIFISAEKESSFLSSIIYSLEERNYTAFYNRSTFSEYDAYLSSSVKQINRAKVFIVFISATYLKTNRKYQEFTYALQKNKFIIVVMLEVISEKLPGVFKQVNFFSTQLPIADEHLALLHEHLQSYLNKSRVNSSIVNTRKMVAAVNREVGSSSSFSKLNEMNEDVERHIKDIVDIKEKLNEERRKTLENTYNSVIDDRKGSLTSRLQANDDAMNNFKEFKVSDDSLTDELDRLLSYKNTISEKLRWLKIDEENLNDKNEIIDDHGVKHKELLNAIEKFNSDKDKLFKDFERINRLINEFKDKVGILF